MPGDDWKAAIARYDADVKAGRITFDSEGFASDYPGKAETDAQIAAFIGDHVVDYPTETDKP